MHITDLFRPVLADIINMLSTKDILKLSSILFKDPKYAKLIELLMTFVLVRNQKSSDLNNQLAYLNHLDTEKWEKFNVILKNQRVKSALQSAFESEILIPEHIFTTLYTWHLRDVSLQTNTNPWPNILSDMLASLTNPADPNFRHHLISLSLLPNKLLTSQDTSAFLEPLLALLTDSDPVVRQAAILALGALSTTIEQNEVQRVLDSVFLAIQDKESTVSSAAQEMLLTFFQRGRYDPECLIQYLLPKLDNTTHIRISAANCLAETFSKLEKRNQALPNTLQSILNNSNNSSSEFQAIEKMLKAVALKLEPEELSILFESMCSEKLSFQARETPKRVMITISSILKSHDVQSLKAVMLSSCDNNHYGSAAAIGILSILASKFDSNDLEMLDNILVHALRNKNDVVRGAAVEALVTLYLTRMPHRAQELTKHLSSMYTDKSTSKAVITALQTLCFQLEAQEVEVFLDGLSSMCNYGLNGEGNGEGQVCLFNVLVELVAIYPEKLYPALSRLFQSMSPIVHKEIKGHIYRLRDFFCSEPLLELLLSNMENDKLAINRVATACFPEFLSNIPNDRSRIIDPRALTSYGVSKSKDAQKIIESCASVVERIRYNSDIFDRLLIKLDSSALHDLQYLIPALLDLSKTHTSKKQELIKSLFAIMPKITHLLQNDYASPQALKHALSALSTLSTVLEPHDVQTAFELLLAILRTSDLRDLLHSHVLKALSMISDKLELSQVQLLFEFLFPLLNSPNGYRFLEDTTIKALLTLSTKLEREDRQALVKSLLVAVQVWPWSYRDKVLAVALLSTSQDLDSKDISEALTNISAGINHVLESNRKDSLKFLCGWIVSHEIDEKALNITPTSREAILFLAILSLKRKIAFEPYLLKGCIPILKQNYSGDMRPYITKREMKNILDNPSEEKHQQMINDLHSFFKTNPTGDPMASEEINRCLPYV